MIDRRDLIKAAGATAACLPFAPLMARAAPPPTLPREDWSWFRQSFVTADGRVTDTGNGGISHSEGQGYGMLLAASADAKSDFDQIWQWTRTRLMVRQDGLAAWKWVPDAAAAGSGKVTDLNNASDGDILIAWALLRAGRRWNDRGYLNAATALAVTIRETLVQRIGDQSVLKPGAQGFDRPGGLVVNPSYWVFPALLAFHDWERHPDWNDIVTGGLALLARGRFSQWNLPPDWMLVDPDLNVGLAEGFSGKFGFDAIRVPLYLTWAGYQDAWYLEPYLTLVEARKDGPTMAATVDLSSGEPSAMAASAGTLAVYELVARSRKAGYRAPRPDAAMPEDYYSASLRLLSKIAAKETGI
ncbi:hypothetical protein N825_09205 [Skermanella stibiiresistens SB22]|uniref:Glucanase n=1 Tax=Skermanella stibiiresistens SB22 TaxID=1385369 RepID=W9GZ68_9PROT|nr:glycosyl hydrolase family 8 [Skermanella stibiiresistens]EWY37747.1 hypothetical protein N825_09205 [Skermanella stibiiresistens SB22]